MADATTSTPAPRRRRRWLRIVGWTIGILVVLLVVVYFVATSSAFLKAVILPKVSAAMNADVTVSDASISPFSQVVLHNLKVVPKGQEPLVVAPEVRLRYSLMDMLKGNIHVDEITVTSPTITVVTNANDSSNLEPILKAQQQQANAQPKPAKAAQPAKASKPPQIDIAKVELTDATLSYVENFPGGKRNLAQIQHLNLNLANLKNGGTAKLVIGADINVENNPPAPATNGLLQAKLSGTFDLALTADLNPASIQGSTRLEVQRAEGAFAEAAQFAASLNCEVTPTDVKEVALRFEKAGTPLGLVRLSGPFDLAKIEGRLTLEVLNIDKNLLNLAAAGSGLDFDSTKVSSTNLIQVAKAGALISAAGRFSLDQFQVTRTNQTTTPLDLYADYDTTVDQSASNAVLRTFTLTGTQNGNTFLRGGLTSPMTVSFGGAGGAVGESALTVTISKFDLADWKVFLGDVAPAGLVNAQLKLLSQQAGKQLSFDLNSQVDNLTAGSGSNQLTQATITLTANGKATDFKQFSLPQYKLEVARENQPLVTVSGSVTYDQATQNADVQLNAQLLLARLLQALPRPDLKVSSGTAEAKLHITQTGQATGTTQSITGNFTLADFTGQVGNNNFQSFGTTADLDLGMTPQQVQIRKISGQLLQGKAVGGSFELSGTYGLSNKAAQITAKLADFNQAGLGTFLQPALGDKKLVSIDLNAHAAVQYDPAAASNVKADLQVTNLVVNDPTGQVPATPLAAGVEVDTSLDKNVVTLRQVQLALTPTARATNQLNLTGQLDLSHTNAAQGKLKLASDGLDFTTYYDLFAGQKAAAQPAPAAASAAPAPAPSAPGPEQEPPPIHVPLTNFTFETALSHIYLHEIDIADVQSLTRIDGGRVAVNPCKLTFNGAPVNALVNLDLGVPGYTYIVTFGAQALPLAPMVNSFLPDRKGILSGTLTAHTHVTGAGTTGASLKKNLTAQFDYSSTNLNLAVDNIQGKSMGTRLLKAILDTVATIPELAKNPTGAVGSFVEGIFSKKSSTTSSAGSLGADLQKSPIDAIVVRGDAGSGKVNLQQANIQSPAFEAGATGTITLADVLTNSTIQLPVSISLDRAIAQRLNLAGNTPPDAQYAKLPDFLTITGTLGNYEKKINYPALAGAFAQGLGGKSGQTGGVLQGLGGLFGSHSNTNTNPNTNTNAPATNHSPVNNLLRGLFKK